jgi:hypothetical protein
MGRRRTRLATASPSDGGLVPFLIGKRVRLTINNFSDGEEMIVRPVRKINEDPSGFLRDANAGDLLIPKTSDFL